MNEIIRMGGLDIPYLKEKYLEFIDVSKNTVDTYNTGIKSFIEYLDKMGITQPTRETVIAFREMLKETHSVATVNSYLIALRTFFKFLKYNNIYENITENVKSLKDTDLHKRNALTVSECQKALEQTKNLKEKVLFLITLTCGLRANEVANIRLEDFKKENGNIVLYVLGKGRDYKQDYVIVSSEVMEIITEYIKKYNITDYLFVSNSNNNKGGQVHPCTLRRIINDIYERAGLKSDKVVFHSLRHSFATIAIENGDDIREVSHALRHKSISVTEKYLHDIETKNNKCSSVVSNCILRKE